MSSAAAMKSSFLTSIERGKAQSDPYPHWLLTGIFPTDVAAQLKTLPFPVPELGGVSGKREVHNATRQYFDAGNNARFEVCRAMSDVFQDPAVVATVERAFKTTISGTFVRIEYAQDTNGFWLEPHTDLGVKKFTMLYYLSDEPGHEKLGTDIYRDRATHVGSSPFLSNSAMIFVPSDRTWHGFEKRTIPGVRKSVIINYVTEEWRAREQLAFPTTPVASAA
jgi:hypothetical protein